MANANTSHTAADVEGHAINSTVGTKEESKETIDTQIRKHSIHHDRTATNTRSDIMTLYEKLHPLITS